MPARLGSLVSFLSLTVSVSCAAPASDAEVESANTAASSPGEKCLADAQAPREPGSDAPTTIEVSHILVRHKDLARPDGATLSRQDACLRALEALDLLQSSSDWNAVVESHSDSGQSNHGELGRISRDDVTGAFSDAAFSLDVNELSYVVESDRGFHIILRTH